MGPLYLQARLFLKGIISSLCSSCLYDHIDLSIGLAAQICVSDIGRFNLLSLDLLNELPGEFGDKDMLLGAKGRNIKDISTFSQIHSVCTAFDKGNCMCTVPDHNHAPGLKGLTHSISLVNKGIL